VLQNNVAEIKFTRRRIKPGAPPSRRMLCTSNAPLLNSPEGISALRYRVPKSGATYNPDTKNLAVTWDIFMQDYRTINADQCNLISVIPPDERFWEYFNEKLSKMSPNQKIGFMNV
jgi:hypothetical protein